MILLLNHIVKEVIRSHVEESLASLVLATPQTVVNIPHTIIDPSESNEIQLTILLKFGLKVPLTTHIEK